MFSSLPKLADRTFIIGFLVPTAAFLFALLASFSGGKGVSLLFGEAKDFESLTVVAGGLWFLALGLMMLNRPIYRFAEGYGVPFGARLVQRAKADWQTRHEALKKLEAEVGRTADKAMIAQWRETRILFLRDFPPTKKRVLPTRFGNANRAFETYAERVHGVDAILIWPRLSGVLSKDMQSALSDARAQVDCFINLCVLALCFAGVQLGASVYRLASPFGAGMTADGPVRAALSGLCQAWPAALMAGVGLLVARLCYEIAIGRVWALGEQVKTAFDLFLPALPAALGYAPPRPWAERKAFWRSIEDAYWFFLPAPDTFPAKSATGRPGGGASSNDEPDDLEGGL